MSLFNENLTWLNKGYIQYKKQQPCINKITLYSTGMLSNTEDNLTRFICGQTLHMRKHRYPKYESL